MMAPAGRTPLHTRAYDINSYVEDDEHFRLTGALRDVRPDGLWGIEDIEPLVMHHMQIELVIHAQTLAITAVETRMLAHPHAECPLILPVFDQLVGLSIARGFSNKVKELFGGPRACTHFGALLNAMAPVAMQTLWAFFDAARGQDAGTVTPEEQAAMRLQGRERNRNTCHVWATEGPMYSAIEQGRDFTMLTIEKRLRERGMDKATWQAKVGMS